jgi:hypothetical protein
MICSILFIPLLSLYLRFHQTCRYPFRLAPLKIQTTAPNWKNQSDPWWMGLLGKHATRLPAAHPRATSGVCRSGCVEDPGSHRFVSVVFPFASSLSMHRQATVRASSGMLRRSQFQVVFTGAQIGCMIYINIKSLCTSA